MQSLGVIFPGQGSQSVGMLQDIAENYPEVIKTYHEASEVLGYDLWKLVKEGPEESLDQTAHTQPALLVGSYALWKILNIQPALLSGHSLGEYTALVAAGALPFLDAVKVVAARGEYMQEAAPNGKGAMAAILGLDNDGVTKLCQTTAQDGEVLTPANLNSPGPVVIAGDREAVLRAVQAAKGAGAKIAKLLPVSVPSHCHLMKPAAEKLKKLLSTIAIDSPRIPVLNNVDVKVYENGDDIRDGLYRQLFMPVRWVEIIQAFKARGVTQLIECGPGKVLTGLNKRIDSEMQLMHTSDIDNLTSARGI
jgi:[acyl-carrier-protein] S-malonyltransferase